MQKSSLLLVALIFALSAGGTAPAWGDPAGEKPSVEEVEMITATATVQAIDLKNRIVTLKGPEGEVFDVMVGERAKNLPQLKVGDLVTATYYESVAAKVYKPGEAPSGVAETETMETAKPGQMPGGMATRTRTVTATVQKIDKGKQTVVLMGPEGKTISVKARNPDNLKNVDVGDEVVLTYTQALAVSVEKAGKK